MPDSEPEFCDKRESELREAPVCVVTDMASQINQFGGTLDSLLMNVNSAWVDYDLNISRIGG